MWFHLVLCNLASLYFLFLGEINEIHFKNYETMKSGSVKLKLFYFISTSSVILVETLLNHCTTDVVWLEV
jgi:hypothetical protein